MLDDAFQERLDAETSSWRDAGCHAELHIDGPRAWQAIVELVEAATDHINVETLEFEDNDFGRRAAGLFAEASLRGVEVNIIIDPLETQWFSTFDIPNFIAEAGGHWRSYWPPNKGLIAKYLFRLHKKILLVDGRKAILGGMNYGTRYFAKDAWRDTNILVTGPVVGSIQEEFIRDWTELGAWRDGLPDMSRYYPELEPTGPGEIRSVDQRPANEDFDVNRLYELLIRQASRRIVIETPYFIPNGFVQGLLRSAVRRGVEVIVVTNGRESNDLGELLFLPSSLTFRPMTDAGVTIYLWEAGFEHTMHAKALLVDDSLAVLGGYNMNNRSYDWDTENVVVLTEPNQVAAVHAMIEDDLSREWIVPVDQEWFSNVSFWDWLRAWLYNLFSWLF